MATIREILTAGHPPLHWCAARWALRALSLPYWIAMHLRNAAYDWRIKPVHRPGVPVISIGNLTVGGTGKTPGVSLVCSILRQEGMRVAVLSRGYGQLAEGGNDEALELELLHPDVPHLQHPDRVQSAQLAVEELEMQVLVLDDGFQHRRVARDLDVVLIDATDTRAAHWLLPGGLLREPWSSLRRADMVILTRTDVASPQRVAELESRVRRANPHIPVFHAVHRPRGLLTFPDRLDAGGLDRITEALAFCGIGNPQAFFRQLEASGVRLLDRRVFPDHYRYTAEDVRDLGDWAASYPASTPLICTVKDLVKIQTSSLSGHPLQALQVDLEIVEGRPEFVQRLLRAAGSTAGGGS
ncbi:MAG: tetraacyldisaccharide 4'-kinase [Planctomycetota bacterium]|nr:MAG: tetraacyldisaccharide 4'-kinase [Planctomycetota bacterium]